MNLLSTPACIYGAVTRLRNRLYDRSFLQSEKVSLPVISIGNLSAGGNGKTPLCITLAHELLKMRRRPVVLSRGYGGRERGPRVVSTTDDWQRVGDEPLMMARFHSLPVVVSRDRLLGAEYICANELGDVILLDDGFQHRRLARELDIVSVDVSSARARAAFVRGELLPAGRFREDRDAAFRRIGLLVFSSRQAKAPEGLEELYRIVPSGLPVVETSLQPQGVFSLSGGEPHAPGKIAAFCGLANPEGFFATLESLGFEIMARRSLRDHGIADKRLLSGLRREASGLSLVCTEKDAIKLDPQAAADVFVLRATTSQPLVLKSGGQYEEGSWQALLAPLFAA